MNWLRVNPTSLGAGVLFAVSAVACSSSSEKIPSTPSLDSGVSTSATGTSSASVPPAATSASGSASESPTTLDAAVPDAAVDDAAPDDAACELCDAADIDAASADASDAAMVDSATPDAASDAQVSSPDASDGAAAPAFEEVQTFFIESGCSRGPVPGRPLGGTCHTADNPAGNLALIGDHVFDDLVNADSPEYSGEILVIPGDPDNSFLIKKLLNDLPDGGSLGNPMPQGEAILWTQPPPGVEIVRAWIAAGAPR